MTPELAAFSDWTLAIVPRLFLYPGGLWLLIALLLLRVTSRGFSSISPRSLLGGLANANLLSVALAWIAVALSPLPGASALPYPVDSLVLAALAALSLLFDITNTDGRTVAIGAAITLALMVPALVGGALLVPSGELTQSAIASVLAIMTGLLALSWTGRVYLASQVRWLAWLCLGLVPLYNLIPQGGVWWASLATALAILILTLAARAGGLRNRSQRIYPPGETPGAPSSGTIPDLVVAIVWLLALAALLVALLSSL